MALICLYESMDCGSLFDQQLDGFEFEDIKACCTPGNTTIGEATECLYPSHFGDDGSLKCWVHDAASGMGYSVPTGFGDGEDSVCISLCWDCGTSTADDRICTEDQVTAEAKISVNSISPRQYLGTYENEYATYGFMLCKTDNCNKADACTGAPLTNFETVHAGDDMSITAPPRELYGRYHGRTVGF